MHAAAHKERGWGKGTVLIVQQGGHGAAIEIGHGQVRVTVGIEVAGSNSDRSVPHCYGRRLNAQTAGAISQSDSYRVVVAVDYGDVQVGVIVEVAGGDRQSVILRRADRVEDGVLEGAISVAQQHGDLILVKTRYNDVQYSVAAQAEQVRLRRTESTGDQVIRRGLEGAIPVAQLYANRIGLVDRRDQVQLSVAVDVAELGPVGKRVGARAGDRLWLQRGDCGGRIERHWSGDGTARSEIGKGKLACRRRQPKAEDVDCG